MATEPAPKRVVHVAMNATTGKTPRFGSMPTWVGKIVSGCRRDACGRSRSVCPGMRPFDFVPSLVIGVIDPSHGGLVWCGRSNNE